jgi:flagellin
MIQSSYPTFINKGLRALNSSLKELSTTFTKLTSGMRINKAADDAAGLAVASNLSTSARLESQALRNAGDAQSALSVADGAVSQIQGMNERRMELAMQSANGTYSSEQRAAMQAEYQQLGEEIQRTAETTEFNGTKLLNGESLSIQVGITNSPDASLSVGGLDIGSAFAASAASDISTQAGAQAALATTQDFSKSVSSQRTEYIGSAQSRLSSLENTITNSREATIGAYSRITDAYIADESANLTMQSIRAQAGVAVLAQSKNINSLAVGMLLG